MPKHPIIQFVDNNSGCHARTTLSTFLNFPNLQKKKKKEEEEKSLSVMFIHISQRHNCQVLNTSSRDKRIVF